MLYLGHKYLLRCNECSTITFFISLTQGYSLVCNGTKSFKTNFIQYPLLLSVALCMKKIGNNFLLIYIPKCFYQLFAVESKLNFLIFYSLVQEFICWNYPYNLVWEHVYTICMKEAQLLKLKKSNFSGVTHTDICGKTYIYIYSIERRKERFTINFKYI